MLTYDNEHSRFLLCKKILNTYSPIIFQILKEYSKDIIIAGGTLRSIFSNQKINDVDFYTTTAIDFSMIRKIITDYELEIVCTTSNAITVKTKEDKLIQFITGTKYTNTEELFKIFDFSITCGALSFDTLYLHENFLFDLSSRQLKLVNNDVIFPLATLLRIKKYSSYGFHCSNLTFLKLALIINQLKFETYEDLKYHLNGIDTTIFEAMFDEKTLKLTFNLNYFYEILDENYFT